jgi:membrane protein implicated in regulation of membrane protease activity
MILLIALLLAFLVVPMPWSILVLLAGIAGEAVEIVWGLRLARRRRARTGAEAMVGATAQVVSPCRPAGQVRVHGELWQAVCDAGADVGETVRIAEVDGLTLRVEPISSGSSVP